MFLKWLNNLKIRNKLIIFFIVPVLTILFFSISGTYIKFKEYQDASRADEFVSVFIQLEQVIYELQNERGLSSAYISSEGKAGKVKLMEQRQLSDEKAGMFLTSLNNKNKEGVSSVFEDVRVKLKNIYDIRNEVDSLKSENYFGAYSEIISLPISIVQHHQLISGSSELSARSDVFTTIILLTELSARERGLVNAVFASSVLNAELIKEISTVVSWQDEVVDHFNGIATSQQQSLLVEKMKHQSVTETKALRDAVLNKASRNDRLNNLLNLIGYGGLIHNFKNYVFRGQKIYLDRFNRQYSDVIKIIKGYQGFSGVSAKEIDALNSIRLTFRKYKSMLKIASDLRKKGKTFFEIDKVVKVNDGPALNAIQYLREIITGLNSNEWWRQSTKRISLIKEVGDIVRVDLTEEIHRYLNAAKRSLYLYIILTLSSLIISYILGYLILRRVVGGIINIESHMSRMSEQGEFDNLLEEEGRDEIGKVAESFNKLISERTKYEEQLNLASMVFEKTSEAMFVTDADNKFIAVNPSFKKLTGYSIEEIKGSTPAVLQSGIQSKEFYIELWNSLHQKGFWSGEIYNRRKNGEIYPEWLNINLIKDSEGKVIRHIAMFTDISERKKMEDEIFSSEQHLKLYREQAPMATIEWNTDFQVMDWNKAAELMFGYSVEEVKGRDFVDVMLPENAISDVKKIWKDLIAGSGGNVSVNENLTKDGRTILCEWHNTALKDESDNVIGAASIVQDITYRTEYEKQLGRSQKMDAIGKLTGGIAHDYNNMLGVILGFSGLLKSKIGDDPKLNNYINQIRHAADRGAKLTKKLLSFTSHNSSKAEALVINTLLRYQKEMLEKMITARIKLHYELEDELWSVTLDKNELEDVVINLCINAMHAIDGNGDLSIKTNNVLLEEREAGSLNLVEGDYVQLSISDTGCGMDEVTKSKMFDPFFSTKGDMGTGLGLSQVYGFVQRSKGGISVTSESGKGTELRLYFPRSNITVSEIRPETENISDGFSGTEVIMVVDDEEALRNLTSVVLTECGYKVICVNSGKVALEMLEKKPVDLLLSDVIMPEMDGFQLAEIVHEKYPEIKIQLASGYTDNREERYKIKKWFNGILYKPFGGVTLLQTIRELLDRP